MLVAPTKAILLMFFAYLAGSIPFGYLIALSYGNVDIREHGSGNIGMTNVFRTIGVLPGIVTLVLDALKGYIPVMLAMYWIQPDDFGDDYLIWGSIICLVAFLAVIGHSFPVWLSFKGGKSVAVSLGVLSALMGWFVIIPFIVFILTVLISRYVSLGSILSAISVPIAMIGFKAFPHPENTSDHIFIGFTIVLAAMVVVRHFSNIKRLISGTESRFGSGKKKKAKESSESSAPDA